VDDWSTSGKFVLEKLNEHNELHKETAKQMLQIMTDVAVLKTKFALAVALSSIGASLVTMYLPQILKAFVK
jgi:hypothetical protein